MSSSLQTKKINYQVDLLKIHEKNPQRYPFLLESVASDAHNNRYDILFAFPQESIQLSQLGKLESHLNIDPSAPFIQALNDWFTKEFIDEKDRSALPFRGGWFLYLAYELAKEIEPVLNLPLGPTSHLPIAYACRVPAAIIVDKKNRETWCVTEDDYVDCLHLLFEDIPKETTNHDAVLLPLDYEIVEENPDIYLKAVDKIKNYIIEGDVFQVNLSRLWKIHLEQMLSPAKLYARLRKSNPAPFSALCCINDSAVMSSSPERLFSVKNNIVETRPIAGTRPRQRNAEGQFDIAADKQLQQELIEHPKERAEHVMLIDLERNDLGRIAKAGSVEVNELMILESYEHVHHIVSNVRAELKPDVLPGDIIAATFPGGTITGCPKIRCMEIIAELEQAPREAYTGSLGYLNRNGDMDLNILIRTIVQSGKELHIRAGAGIVADSDADKELMETRIKAKGMLNAVKT